MLSRDEKNIARRVRKWTAVAKSWLQAESETDSPIFMTGHRDRAGGVRSNSISFGKFETCLIDDSVVVWTNPYSKKTEHLFYKSYYMKNSELVGYVNVTRKIQAMVDCGVLQVVVKEQDVSGNSYRGLMQLNPILKVT
jgi:hypothetical protein